jgi:di/tricarboxylate transporter
MKTAKNILIVFLLYVLSSVLTAFMSVGLAYMGYTFSSAIYGLITLVLTVTLVLVWRVDKKNAKTTRQYRL